MRGENLAREVLWKFWKKIHDGVQKRVGENNKLVKCPDGGVLVTKISEEKIRKKKSFARISTKQQPRGSGVTVKIERVSGGSVLSSYRERYPIVQIIRVFCVAAAAIASGSE